MTKASIPYKRVLLKLSGEALMGKSQECLSQDAFSQVSKIVKELIENGIEVGIVIGGGNIFRGRQSDALGMDRVHADQMGMLATMINGIALSDSFKKIGIKTSVLSAIPCYPIVETYEWQKAHQYLEEKRAVIFVGGTGNPYFTTDSAAALRASELHADVLLKATKVDGVYSKDPMKFKDATRFEKLSYTEVLAQKLDVMDATAIALCMQSRIPIFVFNMWAKETLSEILSKPHLGTLVS